MRTFVYMLLLALGCFLPIQAEDDAFDRALAQVGLRKETARFNPLDLNFLPPPFRAGED